MASAIVRSGIRSALRGGASTPRVLPASKRSFSASSHHDEAAEASKWEKITYLGIAACTTLAVFILSKGHAHYDEPPAYPYLHIRNKEFPWGKFPSFVWFVFMICCQCLFIQLSFSVSDSCMQMNVFILSVSISECSLAFYLSGYNHWILCLGDYFQF